MPAEFECAVCHWPIYDAAAPHALSEAGRSCHTCLFLADWPPEDAAKARETMGQPIMPQGFGRAELRRKHPERAHGARFRGDVVDDPH
jgi:hypothetical protein